MAKIKAAFNGTKKDAIIEKAAALFRSKGFNASSMRELADAVGVEAPSLYNHIGSKIELLQAICFKVAEEFTTHVDTVENSGTTIAEKVEAIIRFHIQIMTRHFDEVFVANHEWKHLKDPELSDFLAQRRNYEKRLISLVEAGIQNKEFKKTNPYVTVLTILSAVRGIEFWQRHKKNTPLKEIENDMVEQLLNGIVK